MFNNPIFLIMFYIKLEKKQNLYFNFILKVTYMKTGNFYVFYNDIYHIKSNLKKQRNFKTFQEILY